MENLTNQIFRGRQLLGANIFWVHLSNTLWLQFQKLYHKQDVTCFSFVTDKKLTINAFKTFSNTIKIIILK